MVRQMKRALAELCMGRSGKALILEIAAVWAATGCLWFLACIIVLLEPLA